MTSLQMEDELNLNAKSKTIELIAFRIA